MCLLLTESQTHSKPPSPIKSAGSPVKSLTKAHTFPSQEVAMQAGMFFALPHSYYICSASERSDV